MSFESDEPREITLKRALEIVENAEGPARAHMREVLAMWSGPFLIYDGGLEVDGSFHIGRMPTLVWGDLHVDGALIDSGEVPTLTIVLGDLRARSVATRGDLCIQDDLEVDDTVFGASAGLHRLVVGGRTRARALVNESHWFYLLGSVEAQFVHGHIESVPHSGFQASELFVSEVIDLAEEDTDDAYEGALLPDVVTRYIEDGEDLLRANPSTRRQEVLSVLEEESSPARTVLVLEDAGLIEVPEEVFTIPNLEKLVLDFNEITHLPDTFGELSELKVLSLDGTSIRRLPSVIGELSKLEVLSLRFVRLESLPDEIESLSKLKEVHLTYRSLKEFPEVLVRLESLESLTFWHCAPDDSTRLTVFLEGLARLRGLRNLGFIQGEISSFPEALASLEELEVLQVYDLRLDDSAIAEIHRMLPRVHVKTHL